MKCVVQRVSDCSVRVGGKEISKINRGLLVYLGVAEDDTEADVDILVKKVCNLRIFEDNDGKMNLSLLDTENPEMMVISQFTLYADVRKGRRPSFSHAAAPEKAETLYMKFVCSVQEYTVSVKHGLFGHFMEVSCTNNGPVTIIIDSSVQRKK